MIWGKKYRVYQFVIKCELAADLEQEKQNTKMTK